MCSYI